MWKIVDRPNLLIKIPATKAGLPAITAVLAEGISVNVTLIFSVERHREVMDAYLEPGWRRPREAGHDLSKIHSVASFFVSRVDTEIDKRLEKIGSGGLALRGKAGVANARLAYAAYQESSTTATAFERSRPTGPGCSARCGPRPASRTPTTPTRSTSPSWSRRTP